jgi:heat shock protein HtpX
MPARHREFVETLCREQNLPPIRLGVIESGTPNAFAFGRVRSDARIVVTRGLLDILTPEEIDAVLAHEVGHVHHYDFAVMAVAALAPLLLYQIYVWTRNIKNLRAVGMAAYFAYLLGQFLVLLLNRTREYHADHFSACVTHAPSQLSSALVKIAYGMVKAEGEYRESMKAGTASKEAQRQRQLGTAVSLMGIAAVNGGGALALGMANPEQAARVMRWDLINPWARFYELNSTHPLTALRVKQLNRQATAERQPTTYPLPTGGSVRWGRFAVEFVFWAIPVVAGAAIVALEWLHMMYREVALPENLFPKLFLVLGAGWAARIMFRYQGSFRTEQVSTLLEDMDVSQMRPRAVELRGEVVGNGIPGAFWSPDLVLQDPSGIMFLLYRSSIPFGRLWFGITDAHRFIGEQVTVEGWYRRGLKPYVEIAKISATVTKADNTPGMVTLFGNKNSNRPLETETLVQRSYSRWIQLAAAAALTAGGAVYLLN